jgi:MEMO1 family protein
MRKSAFDGTFYPSTKEQIWEFVRTSVKKAKIDKKAASAFAYVAPHAGYIYSGKSAAFTYKAIVSNPQIKKVETIIFVGPNHTGVGPAISLSIEDWETPLGIARNDVELSKAIAAQNPKEIEIDEHAHENEHSIEVQIPFAQDLLPDKKMVFICMGDQSLKSSELLSSAIIKAVESLKREVIVIASSDFNHYESAEISQEKDSRLLDAIASLDYKKFNRRVYEVKDSICGFGPITVAMLFAIHRGATNGIILNYTNSGGETGDYSSVVAYSAIALV